MPNREYIFMKALVLGGTGFIGRRLVNNLLSAGNEVTMATSGKSPNPFGNRVSTVKCDRFKRDSLIGALSGLGYHDVVFDTIGYRSIDVKNSLDAIEGSAGKYVYISSAAVYSGLEGTVSEDQFDPSILKAVPGKEKSYDQGKKMSEAYLVKNSPVPVAMARFPIVIGYDDSTFRFQNHVSRILNGDQFQFKEPEGKRNYVWVEDAGRFLAWLGEMGNGRIYNAASPESMKPSQLVKSIAEAMGSKAKIKLGNEESDSSYAASRDLVISVEKAKRKGFKFIPTEVWLKEEAQKAKDSGLTSPNSMEYTRDLFS